MIPTFLKGWLGGAETLTITSPMGMRGGRQHKGVDFRAAVGTEIRAPIDGEIVYRGVQESGAGLYVKLRFRESASSFIDIMFMHLTSTAVTKGQTVSQGDIIGYSGGDPTDTPNCGRSDGAHVHFQINYGGSTAINPLPFLSEKCVMASDGSIAWEGRSYAASLSTIKDPYSNYKNKEVTSVSVEGEKEADKTVTTQTATEAVGDRLAPGIWQITKLLMDSEVQDRQMYDSSIAMQTGALGNFFKKVCQKPLVELTGDTYGDMYYFMVRKPPFDKESYMKLMELACFDVEENKIISTSISWENNGIYSWYQLIPYAEIIGNSEQYYLPAIFFPEYAAIWGSRELVVQDQYVNFSQSGYYNKENNTDNQSNGTRIIRHCIRDLKYLIESNAYMPFTRRGTITLNGDRRYKRGTLIKMPNNEIFYVDSVANSISFRETSVERTTTLTVSRGMFSDFIEGKEINGDTMSYFNIIDFGSGWDINTITYEEWSKVFSGWKVNVNVFAYFLKRSQILSTYRNTTTVS